MLAHLTHCAPSSPLGVLSQAISRKGTSTTAMEDSTIFIVKYRGYVHIDKPSGGLPDPAQIQKAAKLLKQNVKTARNMHPLFARGLDTDLLLQVTETGLRVNLPAVEGSTSEGATVMNHTMHKIAYVVDIGTCTCFIVKRGDEKGKFKCHSFETGSTKTAHAIAVQTAMMCNKLFAKVRKVSRRVKRTSMAVSPAAAAAAAAASKEGKKEEEEQVRMASSLADSQSDVVASAIKEIEGEKDEEDAAAAGTESQVNFLDGVSDSFAKMVLRVAAEEAIDDTLNLDSDLFSFGEITGEADC